jgi:hypothetical protein
VNWVAASRGSGAPAAAIGVLRPSAAGYGTINHRGLGISFHAGVFFFGAFCHNFAENGPQDLKMDQKDASRNSTQSVLKISS